MTALIPHLPSSGPSAADVADRDAWEKAADSSLATVQAAAEKWRTGLAAFVTIVTGGLLIKGPEAASDLSTIWLAAVSIAGGLGLLSAIVGLWMALSAAAGTPAELHYEDVIARHGSYKQYQVAAAKTAASKLAAARQWVGVSLVLLGVTVISWWWAPTEPPQLIKVEHGDEVVCGKLQSADNQNLAVKVSGESKPTTLTFDEIDNFRIVDKC